MEESKRYRVIRFDTLLDLALFAVTGPLSKEEAQKVADFLMDFEARIWNISPHPHRPVCNFGRFTSESLDITRTLFSVVAVDEPAWLDLQDQSHQFTISVEYALNHWTPPSKTKKTEPDLDLLRKWVQAEIAASIADSVPDESGFFGSGDTERKIAEQLFQQLKQRLSIEG